MSRETETLSLEPMPISDLKKMLLVLMLQVMVWKMMLLMQMLQMSLLRL